VALLNVNAIFLVRPTPLRACNRDCLGCKNSRVINFLIHTVCCAVQSVHLTAGPVIVIYHFWRCSEVEWQPGGWTHDTDPEVKTKVLSPKAKTWDLITKAKAKVADLSLKPKAKTWDLITKAKAEDLNLKSKAKTWDLVIEVKAKDLSLKDKAKTWDLITEVKAKDLSLKAKAKTWDLITEAKAKVLSLKGKAKTWDLITDAQPKAEAWAPRLRLRTCHTVLEAH